VNAPGRIALAAIAPSATNPRKRFDETALAELADSIKRHDVIQPILLRPIGQSAGSYELVAGERRYRAALAAGLNDIPATVRELTDSEVLEIQVIENLQRADLHELEEAEGYEKLLQCTHPGGERYSVDEIAAKVGKSRTYVFGRLKLCNLCPEARKAFYAGEIDASKALLVARIGHHDTQRQALKEVTKGRYGNGEPMSYREAHQHLLQNYMLKLSAAPFDIADAKLLGKAGACGPCPKRTGNQADLFGDVKSADVCTDPKCFDDKRQAHYGVQAKKLEAEGFKVIAGEAAKKILPHWEHRRAGDNYGLNINGYERLEATTYASGKTTKVSSLLGKDFKPVKLQHPLTGEIFDVATSQAIAAAATKAKRSGKAKGSTRSGPKERGPSPDEILRQRLFTAVLDKLPNVLGKRELQLVTRELLDAMDGDAGMITADDFAPLKGDKKHTYQSGIKALDEAIPKLPEGELAALALACVMAVKIFNHYGPSKDRDAALKLYGVDEAKVKKQLADETKAAEAKAKEAAAAKKKPKAKAAPAKEAKKPAAKRKPNMDFMKPQQPSAALAEIVGNSPMPKTEITSKLWGYIKRQNLQDKVNRRMVNADAKLAPIFGGKKQVSMFEMVKLVAKHLTPAKAATKPKAKAAAKAASFTHPPAKSSITPVITPLIKPME
jgi:ParB/RepB/Spo0J family partition protein